MGRDLPPGHRFRATMADNVWPAEIPAFKHDVSWFYNALDSMGGKVLEAIATYLKLDRDFFKPTVENGNSVLRLLHYPPSRWTSPACAPAPTATSTPSPC
jgi:isopenicillin N synthase-like dioxygenase